MRDGAEALVVTLLLGEVVQRRFDELCARHFPGDRNHLAAHVTLVHAVPGEHLDRAPAAGPGRGLRPGVRRAQHAAVGVGPVLGALADPAGRVVAAPERVPATGLGLWRYLGGPWEPVERFAFTG